jgi:hypothetical protein
LYAFGYGSNDILKARTEPLLADLEEYYHWYGRREPEVQRFSVFEDYQAETWSRPRRIVAKIEINRLGTNRRFASAGSETQWSPLESIKSCDAVPVMANALTS